MATTIALILRTMEPKLYDRFVAGEVSDADIVDAIFSRRGLTTLRYDRRSATFEAAVILAGLENPLPLWSPNGARSSPLLERYDNWDRTTRETFEHEDSDATARRESEHAQRVSRMVNDALERENGGIGFRTAVGRLELLGDTLFD